MKENIPAPRNCGNGDACCRMVAAVAESNELIRGEACC